MKVIAVDDLPGDPLAAAAVFHQHWLPFAEEILASGEDLLLAFAPADHAHGGWRRAAVAALARKHAPRQVNAVASPGSASLAAAQRYLAEAPGVTGQYLPLAPPGEAGGGDGGGQRAPDGAG